MSYSESRSRRLILETPRGEETVGRFAEIHNWLMISDVPDDPHAGTIREVTWRMASGIELHFSEDDATGARYVFVVAAGHGSAIAHYEQVRNGLPVVTDRELIEEYDRATKPAAQTDALLRLALGASEELDDAVFQRISLAFENDNLEIRSTAIYATTYTPSRRYRPFLERIVKEDRARRLRKDAKETLSAYDEAGIGQLRTARRTAPRPWAGCGIRRSRNDDRNGGSE